MAEYEFTEEQNKVFKSLSMNMIILGIVIIIGGVATIINFAVGDLKPLTLTQIVLLINGILYCIMGLTLYLPSNNFKRIVTTQGKDIKELMTAFKELDKGWLIVNIVTLVTVIVTFISIF